MDRVSRAEAARELQLDRATITRWVQKSPALLDDEGKVSLSQLKQHREEVVNPKLQTRGGSSERSPRKVGGDSLNDTRNRTESAKATAAELDLAERLRLTLRRDDVEAAVAAAGEVLKQAAQAIARDKAEALARITDPREMERALEEIMRVMLEKGSQALTLSAMATDGTHAT